MTVGTTVAGRPCLGPNTAEWRTGPQLNRRKPTAKKYLGVGDLARFFSGDIS